jgi:xylulose-5-phosphate/fructose-6-phosphate phosphoketolase
MTTPDIIQLDAHVRAANYLTVAQLFLRDNILLRRHLTPSDIKDPVLGHWGCAPGINFLYAHICRYIRIRHKAAQLVIGSGHAAPALIANLYLEGTLGEVYPRYSWGLTGIQNVAREFGTCEPLQTEISPALPGTIYAGGELGCALAVCVGTLLNAPDSRSFCVLGDGEMESGSTLPSLLNHPILSPGQDGFLVILINMNAYRMGSRSLISLFPDITKLFESLSMPVFTLSGSHEDAVKVFDTIAHMEQLWQEGATMSPPVVLFVTDKGWGGPGAIMGQAYVGTHRSHKVASLKHPHQVTDSEEIIERWLLSYRANELFRDGIPADIVLANFPEASLRIGRATIRYPSEERQRRDSALSTPLDIQKWEKPVNKCASSTITIAECLSDHCQRQESSILLFSPDEAESNGFQEFLERHALRWNNEKTNSSIPVSKNGNTIEILNESSCLGMSFGYAQCGGNGIFVTYEAFAPVTASQISQIYKFIRQSSRLPWSPRTPSLKIVVTSLGWQNSFTHQNPDFLNTALCKESDDRITVYFPSDANHALVCLKRMWEKNDHIAILYVSKTQLSVHRTLSEARHDIDYGLWIKDFGGTLSNSPDFTIVAIGDFVANECMRGCRDVVEKYPLCHIRVIMPLSSAALQNRDMMADALSHCGRKCPPWVLCTGYSRVIRGLYAEHFDTSNWIFRGYRDESSLMLPPAECNGIGHRRLQEDIEIAIKANECYAPLRRTGKE